MFQFLYLIALLFVSGYAQPGIPQPVEIDGFNTLWLGAWELVSENSGVSAMHAVLLPKINKVLMYDATIWKISKIPLPPEKMPCRMVDPVTKEEDCFAHAVLYDVATGQLKALKVQTDTWCSSGGLTADGTLVGTGGFQGGTNTVRYLGICDTCDWREYATALADPRWYATQVTLADARFVVMGGRGAFSWEFLPAEGQHNPAPIFFPFLKDTHDELKINNMGREEIFRIENNLYPFVHLNTDGNLFVFSNKRSILFDPLVNTVIREYPILPGGSRNYPSSGMSVILPIKVNPGPPGPVDAEVLVCGGAPWDAFYHAETKKIFMPALQDCGRIKITDPNPVWNIEIMPTRRVMGDMVLLPTGDVLMVNGAQNGTSAWGDAEEPNQAPVIYKYRAPVDRFKMLAPTAIPRMYHATAILIPDGRVLISGSNTNNGYMYDVKYPTELRVEKFAPPYLDPILAPIRPLIVAEKTDAATHFGAQVNIEFQLNDPKLSKETIEVTIHAPAFTTHGISMNQRLVILAVTDLFKDVAPGHHRIVAAAPPSGKIAPPGYYLLHVVHRGVPSPATWIQVIL